MGADGLKELLVKRADTIDTGRPERFSQVHDRIDQHRVRSAVLRNADPRRGFTTVPVKLRIAAALAVLAVATFAAYVYVTSDPGRAKAGSNGVIMPLPDGGSAIAPGGRYGVRVFGAPIRAVVTLGDGWVGFGNWFENGSAVVEVWSVDAVYDDACTPGRATRPGQTASVADVEEALDAQTSTDLSAPAPVTVGAYDGVRVLITKSNGVSLATCRWAALSLWANLDRSGGHLTTGPDLLWILDVDGRPVVVSARFEPTDADVEDTIERLVDTIAFKPAVAAQPPCPVSSAYPVNCGRS